MTPGSSTLLLLSLSLAACGSPDDGDSARGQRLRSAAPAEPQNGSPVHDERALRAPTPPVAPTLDGHSLQHLDADVSLVDQRGARFTLASLAGRPTLLAFFYSGCTTMCPLIITDVKRIVAAIPEARRDQLNVVLLSIDPERDSPARLRAVAVERALPSRWHLVTGDEASIRTVASTVGMTYRRLPDGDFAHSALYTVLDAEARVSHQMEGTGRPIEEIAAVLTRLLAADRP